MIKLSIQDIKYPFQHYPAVPKLKFDSYPMVSCLTQKNPKN